jgi:hypothetical protein
MTVWMMMNFQLPRNPVTSSAIRAPSGASSLNSRLTGCRLGRCGRRRSHHLLAASGVRFIAVM